MRKLLLPALALGLLFGLTAAARAQDDPKKIVEAAIKAHGGAEKLEKTQSMRMKSKGTVNIAGLEVEFSMDSAVNLPEKMRNDINVEIGGQKLVLTQIYSNGKGWLNANGAIQELKGDMLDDLKSRLHANRVTRLVPLIRDKEFKLTALGETKVNGKPAVGVKVEAKGQKDISVYFDKESHLLVRLDRKAYDEQGMKEVQEEQLFSAYKDTEGGKYPTKLVVNHDGRKFIDGEIIEMKHVDKIDDKEFAQPKPE